MNETTNKEIHLVNRPVGLPTEADFELKETSIPEPQDSEVLIRTLYLSVDPYMRGRMNDVKSYILPFELNKVLSGGIVAEVVESKSTNFAQGDIVTGNLDWAKYSIAKETDIREIDPNVAPISTHLGVLAMPALTAYFGLLNIGKPQPGETVVVSDDSCADGTTVGIFGRIIA